MQVVEGKEEDVSSNSRCGIWLVRGSLLQKMANKKVFIFVYGITGLLFSSSYSYFNGTITAMEKRFKIPSRTTGLITTGYDICQLFPVLLSYYAGRSHRPRWIAAGMYTVVLFCLMNALPHFIYGPGEEALTLTTQWSQQNASFNSSTLINDRVCNKGEGPKCIEGGDLAPQVILFAAQCLSGLGGSLYAILGITYMDDNIKKTKTPALVSLSFFIRMLGPAAGYALASFCLSLYVTPHLTPTITRDDPRWLGAWWLGWIVIGGILFLFSSLIGLFPKELPRAAERRLIEESQNQSLKKHSIRQLPPSWKDVLTTTKRLLKNKTFMCNVASSVFYYLGYMPYWIFQPKYIEVNYKVSAAESSFITGTFGLIFSAIGILASGAIISKMKPRARSLAMWNVIVGSFTVLVIISYAFMGCQDDISHPVVGLDLTESCRADCHCEFAMYAPVCGDGQTYISACHAGCMRETSINGTMMYSECSCVSEGYALPGPCPVNCQGALYLFIAAMCASALVASSGRTSNLLVSVRCVDEDDKSASLGLGVLITSTLGFIPAPILFGQIIDMTCSVWGQTCSGKGNCWLYDSAKLRTILNYTSAGFVTLGTLLDLGVWFYVKDLKIFDESTNEEMGNKEEEEAETIPLKHGVKNDKHER